jgi:superfamily I DNA and/or RNA helicase
LVGLQSLLLVGDPQQLPPTVISRDAGMCGLGISMFDRFQRAGVKPVGIRV